MTVLCLCWVYIFETKSNIKFPGVTNKEAQVACANNICITLGLHVYFNRIFNSQAKNSVLMVTIKITFLSPWLFK